jgi:hypothetical protein
VRGCGKPRTCPLFEGRLRWGIRQGYGHGPLTDTGISVGLSFQDSRRRQYREKRICANAALDHAHHRPVLDRPVEVAAACVRPRSFSNAPRDPRGRGPIPCSGGLSEFQRCVLLRRLRDYAVDQKADIT